MKNKFINDFVGNVQETLQERIDRELKIILGNTVKSYDEYRYILGRYHSLKDTLAAIEEIKRK